MTLRQQQSAFLHDAAVFLLWLYENGYEATSGEFERTALMAEYYKKIGKSNAGMLSQHCKRLAMDLNIFKDGQLVQDLNDFTEIVAKWESLSPPNSWGGMGIKSGHHCDCSQQNS